MIDQIFQLRKMDHYGTIIVCVCQTIQSLKEDYERSTFHAIHGASRRYEDVSGSEEHFLVDKYEKRSGRICISVFDLSASQNGASTASRTFAITSYSTVKMGVRHYGFCDGTV